MTGPEPRVGQELELQVGPVAHGGHCVARWDGRVVFVRHALPGERVMVRLTDTSHRSYLFGDAVEIRSADPRRVTPPCAHFGPGGCGGCDFQHAELSLQRELKATVVAEQLSRLAGIDRPVVVEPLPPVDGAADSGYRWRTRVRWALDAAGRIGPRATRSHRVVGVSAQRPCEIAADGLSAAVDTLAPPARRGRQGRGRAPEVTLVRPDAGGVLPVWRGRRAPTVVERARGREFRLAADGFWQVHPAAADTLADAVDAALGGVELTGGTGWDLYGGVGLFASVLAGRVGEDGTVLTVESDPAAAAFAAQNLADLPAVRTVSGRVERVIDTLGPGAEGTVDAVVLDPPRSGAGRAVCVGIAGRRPAVVVYVACDPAALARDTATLVDNGYRLDTLRALDLFPQTHHVECVARFVTA